MYKLLNQQINSIRFIRIGVMSSILNPFKPDAGFFMPRLIIPNTGTRMVFFSTYQKSWAYNMIRKSSFHCLRQDSKTMSG